MTENCDKSSLLIFFLLELWVVIKTCKNLRVTTFSTLTYYYLYPMFTPGGAWGTIECSWDWNLISHLQGNHPTRCTVVLTLRWVSTFELIMFCIPWIYVVAPMDTFSWIFPLGHTLASILIKYTPYPYVAIYHLNQECWIIFEKYLWIKSNLNYKQSQCKLPLLQIATASILYTFLLHTWLNNIVIVIENQVLCESKLHTKRRGDFLKIAIELQYNSQYNFFASICKTKKN